MSTSNISGVCVIKNLTIHPLELSLSQVNFQAFAVIPANIKWPYCALMAHGYTAHKGQILNWATRLSEEGIPGIVLDIPGHLVGSFHQVESFEFFKNNAHLIFEEGLKTMIEMKAIDQNTTLLLTGHSLGALLALKASQTPSLKKYQKLILCIGFGMPPEGQVHLFDSPFFEKVMEVRSQLVSKALAPENVFPWIKEEKEQLELKGEKIYLLSGQDDAVVGENGVQRMKEFFENQGNTVWIETPASLPHHGPERAAPHIFAFLKKELSLTKGP